MIASGTRAAMRHIIMVLLSLVSLYPIWFTLQTALKSQRTFVLAPVALPLHPTFANFGNVLAQTPLLTWTVNSVVVTVSAVAASVVLALLASFALVFGTFRGRAALLRADLVFMVVPPVVLLLPMFTLMLTIHLFNTLESVIIFYVGLNLPFSIFFLVNFLRTVPREIVEAGTMDGCSPWRLLWQIVTPMAGAGVFTLVVVNAVYVWNETLVALVFLQSQGKRTLMAGLAEYVGRFGSNEPLILAGAFLSMIPMLLLYFAGQRFFIRGLTAGIGK
ncbi:MAG: carbohydrate ABC transporter permease [Actinomycetota bacterium]|nr:carbohydrate ABC transporter permease [Actinomycetota bacterium]